MILVDTSVWIEFFKKRSPFDLEAEVEFDDVLTCLPILQEVLQGIATESGFRDVREAMLALPRVDDPLTRETFDHAVDLYRRARSQGITVRSSIDCLIAASAIAHDLEVLHRDRDFSNLAKVSQLRERRV